MKFSVVVPCHNAVETIAETLQSVAAQTHPPHQIIVVDDGSTDDSRAQIAASGVAVEVVGVRVGNAGEARNAGIARACGEWIALLDADDLWCPHHLEQAARLLADGNAVAYMANHCLVSARGTAELPPSMRHDLPDLRGERGARWLDILAAGFHFGHSTVIYRRAHLEKIGDYYSALERQEDLDLWLRAVAGGSWAYGSQCAMAYRTDTPHSLSKSLAKSEYYYLLALLRNRAQFPGATMPVLVARHARRALSLSLVNGTRAEFRAARRLAHRHVSPGFRLFYALATLLRAPMQQAIRLKRRWVWRHHPEMAALHLNDAR